MGRPRRGAERHLRRRKVEGAVAAQHYTVRSVRWRYVLYPDGKEELYDHQADPRKWKNLADEPSAQDAKRTEADAAGDDRRVTAATVVESLA